MDVQSAIVVAETAFEVVGVFVLVVGSVIAFGRSITDTGRKMPSASIYRGIRHRLARAILLGLELLVAADIIRTVALEPTLQSVGVLGLIVAVRTFLSWSLEVEISGEWPWQRVGRGATAVSADSDDL